MKADFECVNAHLQALNQARGQLLERGSVKIGEPVGFQEWLEEQPQAVKTAARACPPGVYEKDGELGMVMGYHQDEDDGKVYVTLGIPEVRKLHVHINELTPVETRGESL